MKTHWLFTEFFSEESYEKGSPFHYSLFYDFEQMKEFSAEESRKWKRIYPGYCSTYCKLESWDG